MDQQRARKLLETELHCIQRERSILVEQGLDPTALAFMFPWVHGDKCPIPSLAKVLERDSIQGSDLYNLLTIAYTFAPDIWVAMEIELDETFEPPDPKWITEMRVPEGIPNESR